MDKLSAKFEELFGSEQAPKTYFCPGRVNLIGEHIDYLGGLVMPTAISLGITALCQTNNSSIIRIHSIDFDETLSLNLNSLPNSKQNVWSDFILGVVLHLREMRVEFGGCDILISSNLPKGAGLSSSAALEVLCYFMFHSVFAGIEPDRIKMALDCQKIENNFIGVNCGIMDQFAVANGTTGHAVVLNCDTLEHEFAPLNLGEYSLVVINTNKPRALAESAYNERRKECDVALKTISSYKPISNLVDATLNDLELLNKSVVRKRAKHAITEQLRVKQSAEALSNGELKRFGQLMTESHYSLKDDFEVSCNELDYIVTKLIAEPSCLGARMTGAGFGGCCVALVATTDVENVSNLISKSYKNQFGFEPSVYACVSSNGVQEII